MSSHSLNSVLVTVIKDNASQCERSSLYCPLSSLNGDSSLLPASNSLLGKKDHYPKEIKKIEGNREGGVTLTLIGRLSCDLIFQFCEWKKVVERLNAHIILDKYISLVSKLCTI